MNELISYRKFKFNGSYNREKEDFTYTAFFDYDFSNDKETTSFFRSDFSRSNFISCTFNGNAFGRADFINVIMKNVEFEEVNFGSCLFKNSLIEKVHFQNNKYHGVAIQYSYFKKCIFRNEKIITNMYNCEFEQCTFINCKFEKSSLDHNSFIDCELIKLIFRNVLLKI